MSLFTWLRKREFAIEAEITAVAAGSQRHAAAKLVCALTFSLDSRMLATGDFDGAIRFQAW
jgi:hypothetical protein